MGRERDKNGISGLEAQLFELRQDLRQLTEWMEQVEDRVSDHFGSWSWKIGHLAVRTVKGLGLQKHIPFTDYGIQRVFSEFRRWRDAHPELSAVFSEKQPGIDAQTTVLPGRLEQPPGEAGNVLLEELAQAGSVCVLGFHPLGKPQGWSEGEIRCRAWHFRDFPDFFHTLREALLGLSETRLVVLRPDLPSLGLGLLAHYHFGVPLARAFEGCAGAEDVRFEADPRDPAFVDPQAETWKKLLAPAFEILPGVKEPSRKLPVAARFAEWFARFHAGLEGEGGVED